jgi:hypothetical protein
MVSQIKIGFCETCKKELHYKEDYYLLWHPIDDEDKRFCSKKCLKEWIATGERMEEEKEDGVGDR